jgi:hypothetical protein
VVLPCSSSAAAAAAAAAAVATTTSSIRRTRWRLRAGPLRSGTSATK